MLLDLCLLLFVLFVLFCFVVVYTFTSIRTVSLVPGPSAIGNLLPTNGLVVWKSSTTPHLLEQIGQ
ncbi:hypothetical protein GQ42DRAFT_163586 [Ramicandelaber brevisporus]|nr:hypothetical protein GQ42DRAFT_163586 [Ramicandelaber brevisporus]